MNKKAQHAFPTVDMVGVEKVYGDNGMELRDYFAARAMHALLSLGTRNYPQGIAGDAYKMADLMMEARK